MMMMMMTEPKHRDWWPEPT